MVVTLPIGCPGCRCATRGDASAASVRRIETRPTVIIGMEVRGPYQIVIQAQPSHHGSTTMANGFERRYSIATGAPHFPCENENESTICDQTNRYTPGMSFTENSGKALLPARPPRRSIDVLYWPFGGMAMAGLRHSGTTALQATAHCVPVCFSSDKPVSPWQFTMNDVSD